MDKVYYDETYEDWVEDGLPVGSIEHPYIGEDEETISLLEKMNKEHPVYPRMSHIQSRQAKLEFFSSDDFKQAEKRRLESSRSTEHEAVSFNKVYCPVYNRVRPEWLCANEHEGDRNPDGSDEQPYEEEWEDER